MSDAPENIAPTEPPAGHYIPTEEEQLGCYLLSLRAVLTAPARSTLSTVDKLKRFENQNTMLVKLIERKLRTLKVPFTSPD